MRDQKVMRAPELCISNLPHGRCEETKDWSEITTYFSSFENRKRNCIYVIDLTTVANNLYDVRLS